MCFCGFKWQLCGTGFWRSQYYRLLSPSRVQSLFWHGVTLERLKASGMQDLCGAEQQHWVCFESWLLSLECTVESRDGLGKKSMDLVVKRTGAERWSLFDHAFLWVSASHECMLSLQMLCWAHVTVLFRVFITAGFWMITVVMKPCVQLWCRHNWRKDLDLHLSSILLACAFILAVLAQDPILLPSCWDLRLFHLVHLWVSCMTPTG